VRLGDAERELLFETLKRHHAAGRLDVPELERRVALVAAADTSEQVAAAMADLPPIPAGDGPATRSTRSRPRWGRGHGDVDRPEPGWEPTNERFRDPGSDRVMRVWVDQQGARHYVPDDTR
jgi:hypothetical protein